MKKITICLSFNLLVLFLFSSVVNSQESGLTIKGEKLEVGGELEFVDTQI